MYDEFKSEAEHEAKSRQLRHSKREAIRLRSFMQGLVSGLRAWRKHVPLDDVYLRERILDRIHRIEYDVTNLAFFITDADSVDEGLPDCMHPECDIHADIDRRYGHSERSEALVSP